MGLPAAVRVNVVPIFPGRAQGAGYITVSKANGIYTITADFTLLAALGTIPNPATKSVVVFDTVTKQYNSVTVALIAAAAASIVTTSGLTGAILNTYRTVTAAGDVSVLTTDEIILMNKTVGAATNIVLPTSATRNGVPLWVKDFKGDANTNNITFVLNGVETVDNLGQAAADAAGKTKIDINGGKKGFYPLTSGGWYTLE